MYRTYTHRFRTFTVRFLRKVSREILINFASRNRRTRYDFLVIRWRYQLRTFSHIVTLTCRITRLITHCVTSRRITRRPTGPNTRRITRRPTRHYYVITRNNFCTDRIYAIHFSKFLFDFDSSYIRFVSAIVNSNLADSLTLRFRLSNAFRITWWPIDLSFARLHNFRICIENYCI